MLVDDGAHVLVNGVSSLQHNLPSVVAQAAALRSMSSARKAASPPVDSGPTLPYELRARQGGSMFDKVGAAGTLMGNTRLPQSRTATNTSTRSCPREWLPEGAAGCKARARKTDRGRNRALPAHVSLPLCRPVY
jgi:hypothetical protein